MRRRVLCWFRSSGAAMAVLSVAALGVLAATPALAAERVSAAQARAVAEGWTAVIVSTKGHWAGTPQPQVTSVHELKAGARSVGWVCDVAPSGWIVVASVAGLTPVKAYSTTGRLGPEGGIGAFVRDATARELAALERRLGALDTVPEAALAAALRRDFSALWRALSSGVSAAATGGGSVASLALWAYQGGRIMLSSAWRQGSPYNDQTPSKLGDEACNSTLVGCVPLAAAQVMRYWAWPPYGSGFSYNDSYDWVNMPDVLTGASSAAQIAAVAELCHEAGEAADVDYGCTETGGYLSCWWLGCTSMEDGLEDHFRYGFTEAEDRDEYDSASEWFTQIKSELDQNIPLPYRIPGHVVVVDGWQEFGQNPVLEQYHVNYGWGPNAGGNLGWYSVDGIPGGEPDDEFHLSNLRPNPSVGASVSGTYGLDSFPYRYFDRDASGRSATFAAGQLLQFLPAATLAGTGTGSEAIRIEAADGAETLLFAQGDTSKGMRLSQGAVKFMGGGSLVLAPLGPPIFVSASYNSEFGSVSVVWEQAWGDLDGVIVERRSSSLDPWTQIGTATSGATVYFDSSVEAATSYTYRLRSYGGGRRSAWSETITIRTPNSL